MDTPVFESLVGKCLGQAGLSSEIPILAVLANADDWGDFETQAWSLLDLDEAARARRQRDPHAGARLAMAYALRRAVLGFCLRMPARSVAMRRAPNGRPYVDGSDLRVSLSHSGEAVALAVSRVGAVGIDVEHRHRSSVMHEIAERVASAAEGAALAGLPAQARAEALLSLWVRKEALLKAAGVGLAIEMCDFDAPEGDEVRVPVQPALHARAELLDAGPLLQAALALEATGPDPRTVPLWHLQPVRNPSGAS